MNATPARKRSERGAVALLTAILCLSLFLVAALVIDLGNARSTRRSSQNSSDASALAAANVLYPTGTCTTPSGAQPPCFNDAVAAATAYALANFQVSSAAWTACLDVGKPAGYIASATTPCISFDSSTAPSHVRVKMPIRNVQAYFGGFTKVSSIAVGSTAEAAVIKGVACALCFLGDVSTNNTDFTVTGGSIAVRGDISAGPGSNWKAKAIGVAGSESGGNFTPSWTPIPTFPDPFAAMTLPLPTSSYVNVSKSNPCTDGPGVYGAVALPSGTCTLAPGIYVITGAWGMKNNTFLTASGGVTLYLKSPTGSVDFKNGDVALTPPTTGATTGFVLLADRDNTNDISLQGNGGTQLTGKVYAAQAALSFNGSSCFGFGSGPVVVNGASSVGTKSCLNVLGADDLVVAPGTVNLSQ